MNLYVYTYMYMHELLLLFLIIHPPHSPDPTCSSRLLWMSESTIMYCVLVISKSHLLFLTIFKFKLVTVTVE